MLVILPSFKRIDSIYWVILTILDAEIPKLLNRPRLLVINNYPPNTSEIERIISEIKYNNKNCLNWEIITLQRKTTLPPVENWYSAVFEFAQNNEVVFFVGDDDPLYRQSLSTRHNQLLENKADFILGRISHGLTFFDNCKHVVFDNDTYKCSEKITVLSADEIWGWTAIHLSNHCFIFNKIFKDSYELAVKWCDSQDYASEYNRRLFITYFIPLAICYNNGKVIGFDSLVLYRGKAFEDIRRSKYGIASWNLGYISKIAELTIKLNPELNSNQSLINLSAHFNDQFEKWYIPILFDKRISKADLITIKKLSNFDPLKISIKNIFKGCFIFLKDLCKLNGVRLYFESINKLELTEKLFKSETIQDKDY
jgi:hypothetical protein